MKTARKKCGCNIMLLISVCKEISSNDLQMLKYRYWDLKSWRKKMEESKEKWDESLIHTYKQFLCCNISFTPKNPVIVKLNRSIFVKRTEAPFYQ